MTITEPTAIEPTATETATAAAARKVPTRRISFDEVLADLPRHFTRDGDLINSHLVAVLSGLFPDGEDYFVRSVRHYRDQLTDPVLKREVAGFIGQESMHGREHRAFNERLDELGYPVHRIERIVKASLGFRERHAPPITNLAVTAALEHFTATLAELVLDDAEFRSLAGEEVGQLFLWHALEECEHKAVAFDVYRAVGGKERMRIWTMKGVRVGFVAVTTIFVLLSLLRDRRTYRRGVLRASWRRFRKSALMQPEIREMLREYDRKGFHPDDRDTDRLVTLWRDELFGDAGTMNQLLAGSKAA